MANFNDASTPMRFEAGGVITIGGNTWLNLEGPGLVEFMPGYSEGIRYFNGDTPAGVLDGKVRPSQMRINSRYASNATAGELLSILYPAMSSGKKAYLTVVVKMLRYKGASGSTAYESWTFAAGWCPEAPKITTGKGNEYDTIEALIEDFAATPTPAYSA